MRTARARRRGDGGVRQPLQLLRSQTLRTAAVEAASRLPEMTVRRLLKSWATPPVSWPIASIFCACRRRSSAARCSVRSRVTLANPINLARAHRGWHG